MRGMSVPFPPATPKNRRHLWTEAHWHLGPLPTTERALPLFEPPLASQADKLREGCRLDMRVLALASSRRMLLSDGPIDLGSWRERFEKEAEPLDMDRFAAHLTSGATPNVVAVDCSAAEGPANAYLDWMRKGIHIVTPNKKMNSGSLDRLTALKRHQRSAYIHYLYEGTVGAGVRARALGGVVAGRGEGRGACECAAVCAFGVSGGGCCCGCCRKAQLAAAGGEGGPAPPFL